MNKEFVHALGNVLLWLFLFGVSVWFLVQVVTN